MAVGYGLHPLARHFFSINQREELANLPHGETEFSARTDEEKSINHA